MQLIARIQLSPKQNIRGAKKTSVNDKRQLINHHQKRSSLSFQDNAGQNSEKTPTPSSYSAQEAINAGQRLTEEPIPLAVSNYYKNKNNHMYSENRSHSPVKSTKATTAGDDKPNPTINHEVTVKNEFLHSLPLSFSVEPSTPTRGTQQN